MQALQNFCVLDCSAKGEAILSTSSLPIQCLYLTAGQCHDSMALTSLLDGADAEITDGDGKPIVWPVALAGDKGYYADWIDNFLLELDIQPVIPCKNSDHRDTRPAPFDRESYRERNIIKRLIGWLKESQRIFTRFEKNHQKLRRNDRNGFHPSIFAIHV